MKQFKNLLCVFLAVLFLCSAVCMSVSATENGGENIAPDTTQSTVADTSETTDTPQPDCDSKPVIQETTDTTAITEPSEPDCDSKPIVPATSDPTETTEEPSIPLTGPDGTAPTDPSETTDPTETEPTSGTSTESETAPTTSQQPTETTDSSAVTDPIETTAPTESTTQTDPTETTQPTGTEDTEMTEPTETTQPDTTPKLNKKNLKLKSGETFNLKVKYSKGARVRHSSDNTKIVIVSSSGKVTALKKGTAKITVRMGNKKFNCKVTVTNNPKLKKAGKVVKELNLKVGQKTKVNLVGKAESINNAYFNSPVAIFSALPTADKLKVKALKPGTATIKVKVNNSKTIKLKVKVK